MRSSTAALLAVSFGALALAACSPLTAFNTLTPKDPAVTVARDVAYAEGPRHKLDIYAPKGATAPLPVLVYFYGGGWKTGRRQDYAFVGKALASRGFLTILPDYRLYPQVRYPDFLKDGAAAIRWAQDHAAEYGGDPSRIVLAGHSAGGYNAVMLALDTEFVRAAGVKPGVIKAAAGLAGPYDFAPFSEAYSRNAFGQYPDPAATQPINYVEKDSVPIWMGYGLKDTVVYPRNIDSLEKVLKAKGAVYEARRYEGVDHAGMVLALSQPFRGAAPVLSDMTAFLKRYAGD
jgi:acetyl esterase/lipase